MCPAHLVGETWVGQLPAEQRAEPDHVAQTERPEVPVEAPGGVRGAAGEGQTGPVEELSVGGEAVAGREPAGRGRGEGEEEPAGHDLDLGLHGGTGTLANLAEVFESMHISRLAKGRYTY